MYMWLHGTLRGRPPPVSLAVSMLTDVSHGMAYLHACTPRMIHRDLKSSNVLVGDGYACKVRAPPT
eukprot:5409058-Prymnesium_polylepis.1